MGTGDILYYLGISFILFCVCVCVMGGWGGGAGKKGTNDTTKQVPVIQILNSAVHQALVVQRFDSISHWISHYPAY